MMNNSSTGPLPSERASSEGDFSDFGRCDINEVGECDYGDVDHDQHYLEMFRRALKQRNQGAQRWLEHHFSAMLIDWIQAHPSRDLACRLHPAEYFVNQAFKRSWQISLQHHEFEFKNMLDVLSYLRANLNAAMLDALRNYSRQGKEPLRKSLGVKESFSNDDDCSPDVWRIIEAKLSDARERRLAFLLFHCALRPVEIVRSCPQDFNDVQEVSNMRRDIMKLLSH